MFEDFFKHFGDPMSRLRESEKKKSGKSKGHASYHQSNDVNPATGMPMLGDMDVAGNVCGTGTNHCQFDVE
jgi:hypothetical protein